jgi:hypothetical protein
MTSKRMGIVVVALVAVWGLAGPVGLPPIPGDVTRPAIGIAQAGDPDNYVGNAHGDPDCGAPAESTGSGSQDPPSANTGGGRGNLSEKGLLYASLFLRAIGSMF